MLRHFETILAVLCVIACGAGLAQATSYTITDLGNLGGLAVTNVAGTATVGGNQVVVGTANSSDYTAWYWENGTMTSLASTLTALCSSTSHGTYASSYATGVNPSGQIVGYYINSGGTDFGYAYTLGGSAVNILGSATSFGNINANSVNSNGELYSVASSTTNYVYTNYANGVTGATQIASGSSINAGGINASGWLTVGKATSGSSVSIYNNAGGSWTTTTLGALSTYGGQGFGIDSYGDVVGASGPAGGSASKTHAFYVPYEGSGTWGSMVDLGDMTAYESGYTYGSAYAINNGQTVGYYFNTTKILTDEYAFLAGTTNGSIVPLQNYVPGLASSDFGGTGRLSVADDIDSGGHIVGIGVTSGGADDAFLLTPVTTPEPSTLLLAASGLVGLLAYAWRKRK